MAKSNNSGSALMTTVADETTKAAKVIRKLEIIPYTLKSNIGKTGVWYKDWYGRFLYGLFVGYSLWPADLWPLNPIDDIIIGICCFIGLLITGQIQIVKAKPGDRTIGQQLRSWLPL